MKFYKCIMFHNTLCIFHMYWLYVYLLYRYIDESLFICTCNGNVSNDQNCFSPHQSGGDHFLLPLQRDPINPAMWWDTSPCELSGSLRIPHLARSSLRYGCHPLSLSPFPVPRLPQDWRNACEYCRDRYLELYIAIYLLFDYLHLLVTYLFT